jgi:hemolysin III
MNVVSELAVEIETKPRLRGTLHQAAFFTALGLFPGLVIAAGTPAARAATAIYGAGLLGLFGISALFHRVRWSDAAHARMRRLDHSMIFVFIACTYTPISVVILSSPSRELFLGLVWAAALVGLGVQLLWIDAPRQLTAGLYVLVGWLALLVVPAMLSGLGPVGFALLVMGGVTYTAGAVIYARKRPDPIPHVFGFHEVFHALVILAAILHMIVITGFVLPLAG